MRREHAHHSASSNSSEEWDVTSSDNDDNSDVPATPAHKNGGKSKAASHVASEKKHKHTASHRIDHAETTVQVHDFLQQKTVLDREKLQLILKQEQCCEANDRVKQEQNEKKARFAMVWAVLTMDGVGEAAKAKANEVILSLLDM